MLWSDIAVSRSTWSGLSRVSRSVWYPHTGTYLELLIAEISVSKLGFDIGSPNACGHPRVGVRMRLQTSCEMDCTALCYSKRWI